MQQPTVDRQFTVITKDEYETKRYPEFIANQIIATPEEVELVINSEPDGQDGRTDWVFLRLANGDLVLATYPCGDTYLEIGKREEMI